VKDQCLLICAFRYCLGRCSYVVSDMADHLLNVWDTIVPFYQDLIKREIKNAIERNMAGTDMDVQTWQNLLDCVESEEKEREFIKKLYRRTDD